MLSSKNMLVAATAAALLHGCATTTVPTDSPKVATQDGELALPSVSIDYEKFVLPNGLTLIVHEDHKAPIVAVSVWYHVGSKDEKPGKTGFAHLFEHLMFNGSENYPGEFFAPFEQVGATSMNGTTWLDRTNYFENVPSTAVDLALWMESDRMGHLLGAIDQATLDEQRGVVQNEKRQGENQPYGMVWERLQRASFPEGHPYRWETIGSMEDLNRASLEDVKNWFGEYYGAANTTLVLAGDITPEQAKAKVMRYFGDIPAGPPVARREQWVAARTESTRDRMQDRVAQTRIYKSWNVPPFASEDADLLDLAAKVLGGGRTSRLYQRLVVEESLVDNVSVSAEPFELASLFLVTADVKSDADPKRVEAILDEEMQTFFEQGPSVEELNRAKTSIFAGLVRGAEEIGGFGGKADLLASCQTYTGDPACFETSLDTTRKASPEAVRKAAQTWLAQGDYTLTVSPYPSFETAASELDRSAGPPQVDNFPSLSFPALQRAELSNGMQVVLAERHDMPLVEMRLQFDAGYAADASGFGLGTASFTMAMLDEGSEDLQAREIAERFEDLGAQFSADSGLDTSEADLSALRARLPETLALFADVVRNPAFREDDLERLRGQWLASIAQEKSEPMGLALRNLPPLLYGEGHPYAMPFSGSGTEESITALSADDLRRFHRTWIRPDEATLIVAGDVSMAELKPLLEKSLGDWAASAQAAPLKSIPDVAAQAKPRVFLMDRPGAQQTVILAGQLAPSSKAENSLQIQTMNSILGGVFTARINMNLREDKHWAYGAYSFMPGALGQRPYLFYAPVQTDKTAPAIKELLGEIRGYIGSKPATEAELDKIKAKDVRSLPGKFETLSAVAGAVQSIVTYDRPDDYVDTIKQRTEAQTLAQIRDAAQQIITPDQLTWLIVGDLSAIEKPVRALKLGDVILLDAEGLPQP